MLLLCSIFFLFVLCYTCEFMCDINVKIMLWCMCDVVMKIMWWNVVYVFAVLNDILLENLMMILVKTLCEKCVVKYGVMCVCVWVYVWCCSEICVCVTMSTGACSSLAVLYRCHIASHNHAHVYACASTCIPSQLFVQGDTAKMPYRCVFQMPNEMQLTCPQNVFQNGPPEWPLTATSDVGDGWVIDSGCSRVSFMCSILKDSATEIAPAFWWTLINAHKLSSWL
jgi:hypothetical protein